MQIIKKIRIAQGVIKKIKNWPIYFLNYFNLTKDEFIIYFLRDGQKIKTRSKTNDRIIINEIFINNCYTPKGFEIKKRDVVVDIGAHIGIFSIFASKFASKLYAFEPMNDNFIILKENIEINRIKNAHLFKMAVSNKTGQRELFISDTNSGGHSFYHDQNYSQKVIVPTISLEDFISSNKISTIDFLKMDCEGGEYDIILNCPSRILGIIKKISMECHNIDSDKNIYLLREFLEKNKFTLEVKSNGNPYLFAKNNP